jgi:5'-nucleotidase
MVACSETKEHTITILHTNDTHSQVEPLEAGKRDAFCGGYARRMGLIAQMRENNTDLILLDGGDFCQGTPYYNFYHGRVEIEAMNRMGYDAITLGNHEFDYGVDTLAKVLEVAQFPIVCANYDVTGTPLEGVVVPYTVIKRSGVRVGVFGLGVNPTSLIAEKNFAPIKYLDPIAKAQEVADILREEEKCDVVVCLSHQGTHPMGTDRISDIELASKTKNIDVIIGAHTHKIVENLFVENICGESVLLAQTGKAGARIGEISLKIAQ